MKASKDATAKTLEGEAKMDKNHEHSPGMQETIETSADLTALEKKGLDPTTNHQELVKAETQKKMEKRERNGKKKKKVGEKKDKGKNVEKTRKKGGKKEQHKKRRKGEKKRRKKKVEPDPLFIGGKARTSAAAIRSTNVLPLNA